MLIDLSGRNLERKHVYLYAYQIDRVQRIAADANIGFAEALRDLVDRGLLGFHDELVPMAAEQRALLDAAAAADKRRAGLRSVAD